MESKTTLDKQKTRTEIYSKLWNAVRTVKTNLSDWEFKSYIFSFIFYRQISECQRKYIETQEKLLSTTFTAAWIDKKQLLQKWTQEFIDYHGYYIQLSASFEEVRKKINSDSCIDAEDELSKAFEIIGLPSKHRNFQGLLNVVIQGSEDLNVESLKERNEAIKTLMNAVAEMDIDFSNDQIDFIGDIYEYLIGIKESNSKKVAGQYYTPQEIAELLSLIGTTANKDVESIYDPTCGTGSLLLKANSRFPEAKLYGQEINATSSKLCRMNLIMRDIQIDQFNIETGDTLLHDKFEYDHFDLIVANPPFSLKWVGNKNKELLKDRRFNGLVAPSSFADWAFMQHCLDHLSYKGVAAITCFPGCLYRERVEKEIRKWFVENNYVDCVIQLPQNLFYGTSISAAILVLRNDKVNKDVLFIDASKQCSFRAIRNTMEKQHIEEVFRLFKERKDIQGISKVVSLEDIAKHNYLLTVKEYVFVEEEEEKVDIKALSEEISERWSRMIRKFNKIDKIVRDMNPDLESIPTMEDIAKKFLEEENGDA